MLTKADLLDVTSLAQSVLAVQDDVSKAIEGRKEKLQRLLSKDEDTPSHEVELDSGEESPSSQPLQTPKIDRFASSIAPNVTPVSASTGAGIKHLWRRLSAWAEADTITTSSSENAVREHRSSGKMRQDRALFLKKTSSEKKLKKRA